MATSLEGLADIREAQQRKAEQQAGMVPPQQPVELSIGVGEAALGGMSEANLKQGFAEEAAAMQQPVLPTISPTAEIKQNLNKVLTATLPDGDSIAAKALEALTKRSKIDLSQSQGLQEKAVGNNDIMLAMQRYSQDQNAAIESGGLIGMAAGGRFSGQVPGQGHGMEDNVYMPIVERQEGSQVGTLAVSPDEYVVDAHTMSALGNGSADAGANVMDQVIEGVREKAYGTDKQPNQINGLAALRPMIERV
jgi:hypothetical protein